MTSQRNPLVICSLGERSPTISQQCDCACPTPLSTESNLLRENWLPLWAKLDESLRLTEIAEGYYLGFNPGGSLMPVVMNTAACQIVNTFQTWHPVSEVVKVYGQSEAIPTLAKLVNAGLLRTKPELSPNPRYIEPNALVAWLHVTNACNLHCSYCYVDKTNGKMAPEIGRIAVEAIFRSAIANGFRTVKLKYAGGEPTLNFPLILQINEQARRLAKRHELELDEVILSNGVGWTPDMIVAISERGIRVVVSVDGIGKSHDDQRPRRNGASSFLAVIQTVQGLLEYDIVPQICVTITANNAESLPDLVTWLLEYRLPFSLNLYRRNKHFASNKVLALDDERIITAMRAAFQIIETNPPAHSLLGSLLDRASLVAPHRYPCAAGRNYLAIDHRGRIAKCQMQIAEAVTVANALDPLEFVRGDQGGIQNMPVDEKEGCRECEWRYWCAGGCPLHTYGIMGRYDVRSPYCNVYKALLPDVVRVEGRRLLKYATEF